MARALWSGSLSFGLVNVPVQLFSAVRDLDVHFTQLHEKDGAPIETRRFCAEEDREVPFEVIGHGYEPDDGDQVVLTDEELALAAPRKTRTIDIEAFVDLADVDPIHFDHPYFLLPAGEGEGSKRAYQLLLEVMQRTDRAALGRFVMRTKEYLVIVRVRDDLLALTTMLFHDEIRPAKDIPAGGEEAEEGPARPRGRARRGARRGLGPLAVRGPLPRAPARGHRAQEEGQAHHRPRGRATAFTRARPDGRAGGEPARRPRARRLVRAATTSPGSAATSSTSAPRRPTCRAAPRCPRMSWSTRSTAARSRSS